MTSGSFSGSPRDLKSLEERDQQAKAGGTASQVDAPVEQVHIRSPGNAQEAGLGGVRARRRAGGADNRSCPREQQGGDAEESHGSRAPDTAM